MNPLKENAVEYNRSKHLTLATGFRKHTHTQECTLECVHICVRAHTEVKTTSRLMLAQDLDQKVHPTSNLDP